ncbi:CRISPR-associated endoribonuclease Cas6 [Thermoleptolyngbya oregonensis NK1-22]|uniref:CRISPR-associated endoribonuclease Cas6 n=1 Tax=Thermoleptolyngbya oregonensis NK1-22 TaxID=2547457 RepID=A0AA96Y514_9CYAN|nr:CRISPR-associated endoribonuclease Cas6 [Thermoleptolyngbya oregonensis]WOB44115.1 CRISPR-associated endoribonuclease Cas6 [Thermoleptolyngbya oregonensis NK1-22]
MPRPRATVQKPPAAANWPADTQLVGLTLQLQPYTDSTLYPQYTIGLHAWLLDQVRQMNPELSAYLHDGESEKPFTISALQGVEIAPGGSPRLRGDRPYTWTITALSQPVVTWLTDWLRQPPQTIDLRGAPLKILDWGLTAPSHPPATYKQLFDVAIPPNPAIALSFLSPTSFRRHKHHFPLPVPVNLFHSYLRRWNDFSGVEYDQEDFLDWIDRSVIITRHHLQSIKTVAGKRGSVTGFTGAIEISLSKTALEDSEYVQLFMALGRLAPYCGTGHKTTFGLGQTRLGWSPAETEAPQSTLQDLLAQRIAALTEHFLTQRKRTGGERAMAIAETWATILARRELGESLQDIAEDLGLRYETAKTYAKLARKASEALP